MARQANQYEKVLFDIIKEYQHRFYYESIYRVIDGGNYKINVEKDKEEMVGRACVTLEDDRKIEYEVRYNRIVNVTEGYTLLVPGLGMVVG